MEIARYGDEMEPNVSPCVGCGICALCFLCDDQDPCWTWDQHTNVFGTGAVTVVAY